ncbi:MAG: membrane-bound lytic murein transglycosylase MltF [Steroidobacteraceae bacterium]|nr:membrane-bound lytic murein transglycosylase MltF [Steroidobacteraceae bacterium]
MGLAVVAAALLGTCSQRPPVLDQVRELGELRVATRSGPTSYYLGVNGPEGPEYELASRFARALGVRAVFRPVASPDAILDAVAEGRAHVGAPGLAMAPAWQGRVAFSVPYETVRLHVVYRRDRPRPARLADLAGVEVQVAAGSAHAAALAEAARAVPGLRIVERGDADTLDLLDDVSAGRIAATVADAHEFALGRNFHPELRVGFDLPGEQQLGWVLPRDDEPFAARVAAHFESLRPELAAIMDRYYGDTERLDYVGARNFIRHVQERLPRLRRHFEEAAAELGEDWRVLAAIGYQESKWDPAAVSPTGVRGVMMLTADTAARMGVSDRENPRESIFGGARYFRTMHRTVPERIPEPDRTWFALAAYNLGYGSLEDGRILTQMHGKDPDSWQDVREHLPLLGQERFYSQVKRGYARGWEAVKFVDNVRNYLDILEWMAPSVAPATQLAAQPASARPAS